MNTTALRVAGFMCAPESDWAPPRLIARDRAPPTFGPGRGRRPCRLPTYLVRRLETPRPALRSPPASRLHDHPSRAAGSPAAMSAGTILRGRVRGPAHWRVPQWLCCRPRSRPNARSVRGLASPIAHRSFDPRTAPKRRLDDTREDSRWVSMLAVASTQRARLALGAPPGTSPERSIGVRGRHWL